MFIPTEVNFEPQCFKLDVQITVLQYEPHGLVNFQESESQNNYFSYTSLKFVKFLSYIFRKCEEQLPEFADFNLQVCRCWQKLRMIW